MAIFGIYVRFLGCNRCSKNARGGCAGSLPASEWARVETRQVNKFDHTWEWFRDGGHPPDPFMPKTETGFEF